MPSSLITARHFSVTEEPGVFRGWDRQSPCVRGPGRSRFLEVWFGKSEDAPVPNSFFVLYQSGGSAFLLRANKDADLLIAAPF